MWYYEGNTGRVQKCKEETEVWIEQDTKDYFLKDREAGEKRAVCDHIPRSHKRCSSRILDLYVWRNRGWEKTIEWVRGNYSWRYFQWEYKIHNSRKLPQKHFATVGKIIAALMLLNKQWHQNPWVSHHFQAT